VNAPAKFDVALPVPEIMAIEVLGGGCELPILEKAVGGRPYTGFLAAILDLRQNLS